MQNASVDGLCRGAYWARCCIERPEAVVVQYCSIAGSAGGPATNAEYRDEGGGHCRIDNNRRRRHCIANLAREARAQRVARAA